MTPYIFIAAIAGYTVLFVQGGMLAHQLSALLHGVFPKGTAPEMRHTIRDYLLYGPICFVLLPALYTGYLYNSPFAVRGFFEGALEATEGALTPEQQSLLNERTEAFLASCA